MHQAIVGDRDHRPLAGGKVFRPDQAEQDVEDLIGRAPDAKGRGCAFERSGELRFGDFRPVIESSQSSAGEDPVRQLPETGDMRTSGRVRAFAR